MREAWDTDEDYPWGAFEEKDETCELCGQEYNGTCPISSSQCPNRDEFGDDDDDEEDFADVKDLDALVGNDKEAEKVIDEAEHLCFAEDDDEKEEEEPEADKTH